jgi:hypothetical protein
MAVGFLAKEESMHHLFTHDFNMRVETPTWATSVGRCVKHSKGDNTGFIGRPYSGHCELPLLRHMTKLIEGNGCMIARELVAEIGIGNPLVVNFMGACWIPHLLKREHHFFVCNYVLNAFQMSFVLMVRLSELERRVASEACMYVCVCVCV